MSIPTFPRESVEFLPVAVTVDGVNVTTGVTFAKAAGTDRPTVWVAPITVGSGIGVLVSGDAPGTYVIYAKVTAAGEAPVILCGYYQIN